MTKAEEPFVDYALTNDVKKAIAAGVIKPNVDFDNEYEENHVSELERRMRALDEVEDYVTIKTLIKYHRQLFVNILEYINKEGEKA